MGNPFSTPAIMSDIVSNSDFPTDENVSLNQLARITPGMNEQVGGGYKLSDFSGKRRRFGLENVFGYNQSPSAPGYTMTGVMERPNTFTDIEDITLPESGVSTNKFSLRAVLTFGSSDTGIIFDCGSPSTHQDDSCALYMTNNRIYFQCGTNTIGGSVQVQEPVTGFETRPREILIYIDISNNPSTLAQMWIDGVLVNEKTNFTAPTTIASDDVCGTGIKRSNIPLRNGENGNFTGTIHSVTIYNTDGRI